MGWPAVQCGDVHVATTQSVTHQFVQPRALVIVSALLQIHVNVRTDGLARCAMWRCARSQSATRIRCVILQTIVCVNRGSLEMNVKMISMNALKGVTPATHPNLSATTRTVPTGVWLDKMAHILADTTFVLRSLIHSHFRYLNLFRLRG